MEDKFWNCYAQTIKGEQHEKKGMLCQDRFGYYFNDSRQAIALVDGVGKTDRNIIAGEKVVERLLTFLISQFPFCVDGNETMIKRTILIEIRRIIEKLMEEFQMPKEEFRSTLLGICIDHEKGEYCGVHLGDGIITYRKEGIQVLSYPVNGLKKNQTYLTTSEVALEKMKFFKGDMNGITEFALMTDGIYNYPIESNELDKVLDAVVRQRKIGTQSEDDRSVITLRRNEDAYNR